ncbi:MAG: hypothetical protein CME26_06130 [Gemmatimonadetes bacterium]|nr:hypothetical protein [Gemmatimonadota bacterium]|tara:strand:- start:235 stop:1554 length:1320 start_codon:yes stop_codon:yes gene_type:complete
MSTLTAVLDPQVIDLKARIVADFFVNPFLECTRDALAMRQDRPVAQIDVAVADLLRCGVLLERDDLVVFEPAGDLYEDLRQLASIHRRQDSDARQELKQLESLSRTQDALAVQREEVRAILDLVPVGVLLLDRYGSLLKANHACRQLIDLDAVEVTRDVCAHLGLRLETVLQEEKTVEIILDRLLEITAGPFVTEGSEAGVVAIIKDVSERKELEHEAERTRDEFFSMIRHELRRPLMTIDRYLSSQDLEALRPHALAASGHLGAMLDDLLFLARLERDPLSVKPVDGVAIDALVAGCELAYRDRMREADLTLVIDLDARGQRLTVDERRLVQCVGNLLDNAIKFTPPGGRVLLGCTLTREGTTIGVEDSGPGIPASEREQVLERFYQIQKGDDRVSGLGLGLAICARVMRAHGGGVTIDDSHLGGARIQLHLPQSTRS